MMLGFVVTLLVSGVIDIGMVTASKLKIFFHFAYLVEVLLSIIAAGIANPERIARII